MAVPKATVHEQRHPVFRKHEVGLSRQVLSVQSKPQAQFVRSAPDAHLGRRVFAANAGHEPRATFWR
jgi:hypothetical protein